MVDEKISVNFKPWKMARILIREDFRNEGSYKGQICFKDSEEQEFIVNISQDTSEKMLDLIAVQVSETADKMANQIRNLLKEPKCPTHG